MVTPMAVRRGLRKALFEHSNLHLKCQLMQLAIWDEAAIALRGDVSAPSCTFL